MLLLLLGSLGGCIGRGDGWIIGKLWLDNCKDGEPLGEAYDKQSEFDLHADFFSGEPIEDSNKSVSQRSNRLTIRIQNTSNNLEVSDGLLIQVVDLDLAARSFAESQPMQISTSDLCPGGDCSLVEDHLRASLYLYATCPDGRQPLTGSSYTVSPSTQDATCLLSTGTQTSACPSLSATQRQTLEQLCESDFNDRGSYDAIGQLLGTRGACMFFCSLGEARRGQDPSELAGFRVSYGDRIAAIISTNIVDGRAINLQGCAGAAGELRGMFDFELARGRSAQSFP
jgi:hypothetical protein